MKKTKNIEWIINKYLERVSESIWIEIELLYYDLRYIEDIKELKEQLLCFIEEDIKKDIRLFEHKWTTVTWDIYKVSLVIRSFSQGKNISIRLSLK